MRNTLAQARRILQQFSHDPRTIVMFIVAPILVLWLFSVLLGSSTPMPRLAAVDLPDAMVTVLENEAEVSVLTREEADAALTDDSIDAIVSMDGSNIAVKVEGSDSSDTGRSLTAVQSAIHAMAASQPSSSPDIEVTYLHGSEDWDGFDFLGPVFIGIFIFVFVFITSGMSLVTERTGGTMERLLVTPIKSWQLVLGYCLGFGVVTIIQASIILVSSIWLIGFPNEGNLGLVVFLVFSMSMVSLTLGLLVSALAKTAFQVIQLMILLVVPQILLSGIFDLSTAPGWIRVLSVCFPIRHGADGLRDVMLRGEGLAAVGVNLAVLWGFILVFFALSCLSFARRRASAG